MITANTNVSPYTVTAVESAFEGMISQYGLAISLTAGADRTISGIFHAIVVMEQALPDDVVETVCRNLNKNGMSVGFTCGGGDAKGPLFLCCDGVTRSGSIIGFYA
jgi:hypothetical protein